MNKIIRNAWFLALFAIALYSCTGSVKQDTGTQQESTALENSEQGVFHPEWSKNATIYEVNVRQYTKEGTFKAFAEHLTRLRQMGVDILWFMPIHPISEKNRKGTLGSYYAVQDYKAVNPEFGTLEDFKSVVDQAHDMGFKVLIDWVANHTGWDNQWIKDHPEWYKKDSTGNMIAPFDWTDVAQLDYGNQEMREAMIDALSYWVSEADIDGYRCDVAGMVPVDFWANAREQLNEIKPVFMLAEDESEIALLEEAFNMNYGWEFHHIMNGIAKGKKNANDIMPYFDSVTIKYPEGAYAMQFITNHDENSWNGTVFERLGDGVETFAVLSFTVPGMPLIYSGQEAGMKKRLEFFEKDQIDWSNIQFGDFYQKLDQLKNDNKALWNGSAGAWMDRISTEADENVFAFKRTLDDNTVLVVLNLSGEAQTITLQDESINGEFTNYFANEIVELNANPSLNLKAWGYQVYIK
ncbi:MAG TPA: alpha-amylase [Cytophagales bacterium]|jgi:glycosidase|nr:alpha-amylase [Cytophagales bacterium]